MEFTPAQIETIFTVFKVVGGGAVGVLIARSFDFFGSAKKNAFDARCSANQAPLKADMCALREDMANTRISVGQISGELSYIARSRIHNGGFDKLENDISEIKKLLISPK